MASSTAFPTADDPNKPCEKCGAPASWTAEWADNLPLSEGIALQFRKYDSQIFFDKAITDCEDVYQLTSPRMFPIGYILDSPYSPFFVERQIPNKHHWRDAFEDLLALDSGGTMIDSESRSREAVVAERLWTQRIHRNISAINKELKEIAKYTSLLNRMRAAFVRKNERGLINLIDEQAIPSQRAISEKCIAQGQKEIAMLRDKEIHDRASMYKSRGQWIASLISSGAISGWETDLYDSSEGHYFNFEKIEPAENGERDGLMMTELELDKQFEEGIHHKPGKPQWSTASLRYPDAFSSGERPMDDSIGDADQDDAMTKPPQAIRDISPLSLMPTSILAQNITAERTMLRNGKMSVNVLLRNCHTNGTVVEKEIKDDPCKVLEEVGRVHNSMADMHDALTKATWEQQYALQEEAVRAAEDDLD